MAAMYFAYFTYGADFFIRKRRKIYNVRCLWGTIMLNACTYIAQMYINNIHCACFDVPLESSPRAWLFLLGDKSKGSSSQDSTKSKDKVDVDDFEVGFFVHIEVQRGPYV